MELNIPLQMSNMLIRYKKKLVQWPLSSLLITCNVTIKSRGDSLLDIVVLAQDDCNRLQKPFD